MSNKHTFSFEGDGSTVQLTETAVSWPELAEMFYNYLCGCGFVLDKQDLSNFFYEETDDQPSKCENCQCTPGETQE